MPDIKSILFKNTSTSQTIFKNTFWLFAAEGISKGLMFFLTILIARHLGAAGYGKFSFAFAFVALFAVIADFGLSTLTIREVARNESLARKYIDNITVIKLILGIITFALIVIAIQFLDKTPEVKTLIYLTTVWIVIQYFTEFFRAIFRAFQKMEYEALSKIIYSVSLFLIAGFVLWQNLGIIFLVQSYIYAAIITFLVTLFLIRKKITKFWVEINFSIWKRLLKEAWPFALSGMFILIYMKIDIIMLSQIIGDRATGLYSAVYNLLYATLLIPAVITTSLYPVLSKKFQENNFKICSKIYKKSLALFFIIGCIIVIIAGLFGKKIVLSIYGAEFVESSFAFFIISFAVLFSYISHSNLVALNSMNMQKKYFYSTVIAAILNVFLNLFIIPKYSFNGAAITTVISEAAAFIYCFYFVNKNIKLSKNFNNNS